jgi:ABC-type branched-subunit amino acid transport system substrate-binding protein
VENGLFQKVTALILLCWGLVGHAKSDIVLGVSNATEGPSAQLGVSLNRGAELYFDQINHQGGIKGQTVRLEKLNDGYEPDHTVSNTKRLLDRVKPLALFNYVGTPTTKAIMPILGMEPTPLLMPFTGADFLREASNRGDIFHFRASYQQEAESQVDYLVKHLRLKNIAMVIQADEFGLALEKYYTKRLEKYKIRPSVYDRYRRNTKAVLNAERKIKRSQPQAVLFVGTYEPLAELINSLGESSKDTIFVSVSFVSSHALLQRIPSSSKVLVTEVVPDPKQCQFSVCEEFRQLAKKSSNVELNPIEFEGFINAKLFSLAAESCENVSQACLSGAFKQHEYNLGGIQVVFNRLGQNQTAAVFSTSRNLPSPFQ